MLTTGELDLMLPEQACKIIRAELSLLTQSTVRLGKGNARMWYGAYLLALLDTYTPQPSTEEQP